MSEFRRSLLETRYPEGVVVQGGMGVRVFGPNGVSSVMQTEVDQGGKVIDKRGNIGTLSETAMGYWLSRELQDGDPTGLYRKALQFFPNQDLVTEILKKYFQEEGIRPNGQPTLYRNPPGYRIESSYHREIEILTVMGTFCDTLITRWFANGMGTLVQNGLTKIDRPTPAALYGGMLAEAVMEGYGIDATARGAGAPLNVPKTIDLLYDHKSVDYPIKVQGDKNNNEYTIHFDPRIYNPDNLAVSHPELWAIATDPDHARGMASFADAIIIESRLAGGHNGSGPVLYDTDGYPIRVQDFEGIEVPVILAGGVASWGLAEAIRRGRENGVDVRGIQAGSVFVYTKESDAASPEERLSQVQNAIGGRMSVEPDNSLSPTGFPFWRNNIPGTGSDAEARSKRSRICDLTVLEVPYITPNDEVGYRCPAAPNQDNPRRTRFKGPIALGKAAAAHCLCNELLTTAGKGQKNMRKNTAELSLHSIGGKGPHDIRGVAAAYGVTPQDPLSVGKVMKYLISGAGLEKTRKVAAVDYWNSTKK